MTEPPRQVENFEVSGITKLVELKLNCGASDTILSITGYIPAANAVDLRGSAAPYTIPSTTMID